VANHIEKGDAVVLAVPLEVRELKDAEGNPYLSTVTLSVKSNDDIKPPYMLFECLVGIYLGRKYIPQRQHRRGIIRAGLHAFLFGTREVYIDPDHVTIARSFDAEG
jgi:hypothetical protein